MRVTIKELKRIIKEEYVKVLEEAYGDVTSGNLNDDTVLKALGDVAAALSHSEVTDKKLANKLVAIIDHNIRTPITIGNGSKESFNIAMNNLTTIQDIILGVTPEELAQAAAIRAAQEEIS